MLNRELSHLDLKTHTNANAKSEIFPAKVSPTQFQLKRNYIFLGITHVYYMQSVQSSSARKSRVFRL